MKLNRKSEIGNDKVIVFNQLFCCRYVTSLRGHVKAVYQISWSADNRLLVSGSADSTLKVWDVRKGKLMCDLPGHADEVSVQKMIRIYRIKVI